MVVLNGNSLYYETIFCENDQICGRGKYKMEKFIGGSHYNLVKGQVPQANDKTEKTAD